MIAGVPTLRGLAVHADARAADRLARTLDRVLWLRLEVDGDDVSGVVAGVRRRRPVWVDVGASTALGLVDRGVPAVVRTTGGDS